MRMITAIVDKAIVKERIGILRSGLHIFTRMASMVAKLDNLTEKMKERIIRLAYYYAQSGAIKSIKRGFWENTGFSIPIRSDEVEEFMEMRFNFTKDIVLIYSNLLLDLCKYGVLDTFTLNDYRAFILYPGIRTST
jgi:hypothetical protein